MDDLIRQFEQFFDIVPASSSELVQQSQQLRYRVYCLEQQYEDPKDHPFGLEIDEYDTRSVHTVLRHKRTGLITGTVRLVLADANDVDERFPTEALGVLRRGERDHIWRVPRNGLGEISRFAVSKAFRRRAGESDASHGISNLAFSSSDKVGNRLCPHITLGLFKAVVQMSYQCGVTHWYAVMEPKLIRLLRRFGIEFIPIGPLVNYHGSRQPCIGDVSQVLAGIHERQPLVWDFITNGGYLTPPTQPPVIHPFETGALLHES